MSTKAQNSNPHMVFTMGLPGAGKSTVIQRENIEGDVIDPDAIKEAHADYDPKNPTALHTYSLGLAEQLFNKALTLGGQWIIDGTGTNAEKMVRKITQAQAAGFTTELLYVQVTLKTSLARNAARERTVPEDVVRAKALDISTSFDIVSRYADTVTVKQND